MNRARPLLILLIFTVAVVAMYLFSGRGPDRDGANSNRAISTANATGDELSDAARSIEVIDKIDAMSLDEKRAYYLVIGTNEPYVPIADLLVELDRGLIDPDFQVQLFALNRFILTYYQYGSTEPSALFNADPTRKRALLDMLTDPKPSIREGSFRVLAENYFEQEDVARQLADAVRLEKDKRLHHIRSFAHILTSFPDLASSVYIDEVRSWATATSKAAPVDSVVILSSIDNPPTSILEPIVSMLENDYFGSPALLRALKKYGTDAQPYLDRLRQLQSEVNNRIRNGRDRQGRGSTTFSREEFTRTLQFIEG